MCALIAVNMILLLCAAWVVVYAGLIFLGFGGCRWTSDMAINYYRTVLGVGVSLMTMQLIIGIGVQFLKDLVASTGQNLDAPTLAIIMIASIILAVIAHRLPQMVAGMVVGGGHNGAIGGVGIMTLLGTGVAMSSMAEARLRQPAQQEPVQRRRNRISFFWSGSRPPKPRLRPGAAMLTIFPHQQHARIAPPRG